jgi:adhesin transport system outer membrane protein
MKMIKIRLVVTGLVWAFLCSTVNAQLLASDLYTESKLPPFQMLMQAVLKTHPLLQARRLTLESSRSEVMAARLQFLPNPSVSLDSLEGKQANVFRLTQPLFDGGKLTSNLKQANLKETSSNLAIEEGVFEIANRLAGLYQTYSIQSGRIQALSRGISAQESLDSLMRRRVDAGVSADIDKNLSNVRLVQARTDLSAARSLQQSAYEQIIKMTGLLNVESIQSFSTSELPKLPADTLDAFLQFAMSHHPTFQQLNLQKQLAEAELRSIKAELWPVVSLRAERQTGDVILGSLTTGNRVYLGAQYSLGSGISVLPKVESAQTRVQAQSQQQMAQIKEMEERLVADWYEYQSVRLRLSELQEVVQSTQDFTESTKRLFVTGRRSWLDLQNTMREQMQADIALSDARSTLQILHMRLLMHAGYLFWNED